MDVDVVDESVEVDWPIEDIPGTAALYLWVHKNSWTKREPDPYAFDPKPANQHTGLSTDWEKHSTPEDTRSRSTRQGAENYGVVGFVASNVRAINGYNIRVEHDPVKTIPRNRAHTQIWGRFGKNEAPPGRERLRVLLQRQCQILIHWSEPV